MKRLPQFMPTPKGISNEESQGLIRIAQAEGHTLKVVANLAGVCETHIYHIRAGSPRHRFSTFAADRLRKHLNETNL